MIGPPGAVKYPEPKEIKVGSTVTLPFDQFQSMHLTFRLAITVFQRERRPNRIIVPIQPLRKATEFRQSTRFCFIDPAR
jgi:hypothetical protein